MTRRHSLTGGGPSSVGETGREWTVYIVQCADSSLYTGVTTNLPRRLAQHQAGTGAKYTVGRGPFTVRLLERYASRSAALKREAAIKALDRAAKMVLIAAASRAGAHDACRNKPSSKMREDRRRSGTREKQNSGRTP